MYYEEAEVKEYIRNKNKPSEKKFKQIYLGTSNFKKEDNVVIIKSEDFNKLNTNSTAEKVAELEAIIKDLTEEKLQLEQNLQELKKNHEKYIEETNSSIEEATTIVNTVKEKSEKLEKEYKQKLEEKDSAITKKDSIIEDLTNKLANEKDYSKALLIARTDLLKRNVVKRLFNLEPDSSKMVAELKPKEIDIETTSKD